MPEVIGANNSMKNSKLSFTKNDRGLLPADGNAAILKSKIYNNSHAQVSPNSYNSGSDIYSKSIYRNSNKIAK